MISNLRHIRRSRDSIFLEMTVVFAMRSTCSRKHVACILVDDLARILAGGYNGPPSGWPHCTDFPCKGAESSTGTDLDKCEAIHAEQNALLQCGISTIIYTAYCTHSPCIHCAKLLLNTSCERIVFRNEYSHTESKDLWLRDQNKRQWIHLP